jgi:hypothetical protein
MDDATKYMGEIAAELLRAEQKFPGFPTDPIHAASIVGEESGELMQAALQHTYEGGSHEALMREAIHTGAMALRFLIHLKHMHPQPCTQQERKA